ncbi:type II toxin-antitoxin system Phd/YefM family antitoxin (plasmid) [Rhizobium beringeri]|uniref:type II toxin-antitoxin system Phd/YefM family antitoxin n=1 Tax=Rhizobium TaxID=379 RepID=UPI001FDEC23C|nr:MULTISPECIES: type II toxin-antitoxin system Phd/YefM family antitoxin [Rhizobium]WSG78009.1 type II toxin-antitoxin system Phd/YefM family antitoxin [Rhizobium beringeri]WSH18204.1 type II toxin-antitoxin system Phd/YefM family antitoxin [Rhizobium beringeri]
MDGFDENVLHDRRSLQPESEQGEEGASERPLVITDRGEAAYVLVSYAEFQVNWTPKTLFEALPDPSADEREFEPARVGFGNRTVEF